MIQTDCILRLIKLAATGFSKLVATIASAQLHEILPPEQNSMLVELGGETFLFMALAISPAFLPPLPIGSVDKTPLNGVTHFPSCCPSHRPPQALYINSDDLSIQWLEPNFTGSFGHVYFGRDTRTGQDVVVKCPIDEPLARSLYSTEKYVNTKLKNSRVQPRRWAEYLGEVVVPRDEVSAEGVARIGLVWKREGGGETLEEMLRRGDFVQLSRLLGVKHTLPGVAIRRELFTGVVWWLLIMLKDLQALGLYHRDIKPRNIIVTNDPGAPLKAIDFGSTVDWKTPFKRGLSIATCDETYGPPERKINIFAASRYDIYAVGLLGLRVLLPSLTPENTMKDFIENVVRQNNHDFPSICAAAQAGSRGITGQVRHEMQLLLGDNNRQVFKILKSVLREKPQDRLTVEQVLDDPFFDSIRYKETAISSM